MKQLTLALLLSVAPLSIVAENCCKSPECATNSCTQQQIDDETREASLTFFDNEQAQNATTAFLVVERTEASDESWNLIVEYVKNIFGNPDSETQTSVAFSFKKDNLATDEWQANLEQLKADLNTVCTVIKTDSRCTGARLSCGLGLQATE